MRIIKTFKEKRTPAGIQYLPQLTGEITCTLNNQYNSNEVYKYGNSNSISFTANLLLTQNDVYLIKKYIGKQLPEGEFATVRVCMFGKDGDHLAKQPLCKHGQKIAFYATDWEITQGTKANGGIRYYFNAIAQYYRFIDDQEATEHPATTVSAAAIPAPPATTANDDDLPF